MTQQHVRTAMLIGERALSELKSSHVMVFGLGGVGSFTVEALARAGVGKLTLVDGDKISLSNINRQLFALHSTVGMYKTDVAAERIKDINPECEVIIKTEFVTDQNINEFFSCKYDFCVDAIDDTNAKTEIALMCRKNSVPIIAAMGTGSKLSAKGFMITDIKKTEYCPLCRVMRKKYKTAGVENVTVLYSKESAVPPAFILSDEKNGKIPPSSISYVPSQAGLMLAEYVISELIKEYK